jgi:hypothetical protein
VHSDVRSGAREVASKMSDDVTPVDDVNPCVEAEAQDLDTTVIETPNTSRMAQDLS